MALPFYFLLSFFFLPKIYCFCSPKKCGDITIKYPFYVADTPPTLPDSPPPHNGLSMAPTGHLYECNGPYKISCEGGQAKTRLGSDEFPEMFVMNISYKDHFLIINDTRLSPPPPPPSPPPPPPPPPFHKPCGFFVNFQNPFLNFHHLISFFHVNYDFDDSPDCDDVSSVIYQFLSPIEPYSLTECKDYNIHYWNESDHDAVAAQPAFEWMLSFNETNDKLSLMSFGFSQNIQFLEDCFNCQVGGKNCTSNNCGVNSTCAAKKNNKGEIIGIVCGTVGGFVVLSILVIFCYKRKKRYHQSGLSGLLSWSSSSKISSKRDVEVGESSNYHTHIFSYDELEEATGGFNASRELGDGGFGTVYKGKLRDGRTVAVKRLYDHNYRRLEQFMNEVEILSRLRHQNLVTLYGCTSRHSRELLLVYEYIPNGTVGDHLHGPLASKASLSWPIRLSIAIETADALAYLHHVEPQIIHRDVKTNNILLDNNHHVKVADFGLSRLFPLDATHVSTAPQGTPGYVDPEYHQCYQLTDKSDVYSFGVVLIELISSKPAVDISRHRHEINLANLAVNKIQNCQLDQLVDPNLGYDVDLEVKRMIDQVAELAFRCLQSDREMRPGIREVLELLRVIEDGGYKEGEGVGSDVMTEEESGLLKRGVPVSPDTVTGRWPSRTSTPNTST